MTYGVGDIHWTGKGKRTLTSEEAPGNGRNRSVKNIFELRKDRVFLQVEPEIRFK